MKRTVSLCLVAITLVLGGCFKSTAESSIKSDGTATIKMSMAYKTEVLANLKSQLDQAIEMLGDGNPEIAKAKEQLGKVDDAFNEKKVAEEWKKLGLEVGKSSSSEKDGWKGFEIEASTKNVAEYNRKYAETHKSSSDMERMGDPAKMSLPRFPKFYKTAQPNVAKVSIAWRDASAMDQQMDQLEGLSDDDRAQAEEQFDAQRAMMGLDEMKVQIRVKLPGKILTVSNAKQEGDNTLVFELLGSSLSLSTLPKMLQVPSATIQIDPKEFKIPLEDEPKAAESKPASRKSEKPKKDEEEKKGKDEDKDK
jgi:hypothetical protein